MNPIRWVRWKLLAALTLVIGGFTILGVSPLAKATVNRFGSHESGTCWNIEDFAINPITGNVSAHGLDVANRAVPSAGSGANASRTGDSQILAAQAVLFDLDMKELLRHRYCGEMKVVAPKLRLERRADGSMNLDFDATATAGDSSQPVDWWEQAQKWVEQLKQWNEKRRELAEKVPEDRIAEKAKEVAARGKSRFRVDYSKRVTYPFEHEARFVAKRLLGEGLEIAFLDNSEAGRARGSVPPLKNGRILIENVSDRPEVSSEPIRWTISGDIAGAPIELVGTFDQRQGASSSSRNSTSHLEFDFHADGLPIELAQFFIGSSLPIQFDSGSLTVAAHATINDWHQIDVRPRFAFHEATVSPASHSRAIAGVPAEVFCRAFNEVGTIDISDLRVTGTVTHPEVELGETVSDLVRNGGRAIAKKQLEKGLQFGTETLNKAVDKELNKLRGQDSLPPEVERTVDEVKKGLGDRLKGLPFGEKSKPGTTKR